MRLLEIVRQRIRSLFFRTGVDRELEEEVRYHMDRDIQTRIESGMNGCEARRATLRAACGIEQRMEECRDARGWTPLDNLRKDVAFAFRQWRKNPGFACTATLVLALGICSGVSIFAFVDAALLQPLPYRDPARLVAVYGTTLAFPLSNVSYPDYLDLKQRSGAFSAFDIYQRRGTLVTTPAGTQPASAARVGAGFFRTLGVTPLRGRDFLAGEDQPSAPPVVLLSCEAWLAEYGGKEEILGRTVTLDGEAHVIVGVLPRDFHFAPVGRPAFWIPFRPADGCDLRRSCHAAYAVARLGDGVTVETARADLKAISGRLEKEYPDSNRDQGVELVPLAETILGGIRPTLLILLGGAGLLLLIAAVNVCGLLLLRAESRRREIAVRRALGASSTRLIFQFTAEGVLLALAGGTLGLAAAAGAIRVLRGLLSEDYLTRLPFLNDVGISIHSATAGLALSAASALLLALPPILHIWSPELHSGLTEAGRGSAGTVWRRLGSKLVIVELATAMLLLAAAGLLAQSQYRLLRVKLGLQPERLATVDVHAPRESYGKPEQAIALARRILERMPQLPGVRSVGLVENGAPLTGNGNTTWFHVAGRPWHGEHNDVPERDVSTGYFTALGARLLEGRYFDEHDDDKAPRVAIVNRAFAGHYFPGESPVGRQLASNSETPVLTRIVGVIDDVREGPLDAPIPPVLYLPFEQNPDNDFSVVVRTVGDERPLLPVLAATIRQIDQAVVPVRLRTMTARVQDSPSAYLRRSVACLVGAFAAMALLLSVIGLYGVVAYSASRRKREIGIRVALGAHPMAIYRLILREAARLIAFGVAIGLACSGYAASLIRVLLFGVGPWDIPTLAAVAVCLSLAALLACLIPAHRAASANPVASLTAE
jgi:macrolide transport system ATP-binding/permease protein